jgi:hypothetical protein
MQIQQKLRVADVRPTCVFRLSAILNLHLGPGRAEIWASRMGHLDVIGRQKFSKRGYAAAPVFVSALSDRLWPRFWWRRLPITLAGEAAVGDLACVAESPVLCSGLGRRRVGRGPGVVQRSVRALLTGVPNYGRFPPL